MHHCDGDPHVKVLDYGDVLLRAGDVKLLNGPYWLNDQCIAFYFEYLSRELLHNNPEILLVPPATSFLVASSGTLRQCTYNHVVD